MTLCHIIDKHIPFQQGGEPDINTVAKIILSDFQRGKLPYFVRPPKQSGDTNKEDEKQTSKKFIQFVPESKETKTEDQVDKEQNRKSIEILQRTKIDESSTNEMKPRVLQNFKGLHIEPEFLEEDTHQSDNDEDEMMELGEEINNDENLSDEESESDGEDKQHFVNNVITIEDEDVNYAQGNTSSVVRDFKTQSQNIVTSKEKTEANQDKNDVSDSRNQISDKNNNSESNSDSDISESDQDNENENEEDSNSGEEGGELAEGLTEEQLKFLGMDTCEDTDTAEIVKHVSFEWGMYFI